MAERLYEDPVIGTVRFTKSTRCRRISIRVHPERGVRVSYPFVANFRSVWRFYESKRDWIIEVMQRQRQTLGSARPLTDEQISALRVAAREYLPGRLAHYAAKYGFTYNRLALKNNVSNWGSCSGLGNINLNIRLMMLPERLRDYVILHELTHLEYHDHSPAFHARLEHLCADNYSLPLGTKTASQYPVSRTLERELKKRPITSFPGDDHV